MRRVVALRRAATTAGLTAAILAGSAGVAPAATSIQAATRKPATKARNQVSITRDSAGIPHIRAKNFTLLGIGEGYRR